MKTYSDKLNALVIEFAIWMRDNGIGRDAGDAEEILASGKLDEKQAAYVREFIRRWEANDPHRGGERWHVERQGGAGSYLVILDENRLQVALLNGDPDAPTVIDAANVIAAAPQLQDMLAALIEFADNGTPLHPGALIWEDARATLAASRGGT